MIITERMEENGIFWLPHVIPKKISGTLLIENKGDVSLILREPLVNDGKNFDSPWVDLDIIHGEIANEKITLFNSRFKESFNALLYRVEPEEL